MFLFWLLFAIALLGAEAVTLALFALFIALGALAAMLISLATDSVALQVAVFSVVSLGSVLVVRPPLMRAVQRHRGDSRPDMQTVVGQTALTVGSIGDEHHPGHCLLSGEQWLAVTDQTQPIGGDAQVVVIAIRGTTLLVRPVDAAAAGPEAP